MRIVLVSTWYPMAISRFFERAFKRRDDLEIITAGPYTGSWIPWAGGMHLPDKYAIKPDIDLPTGAIQVGHAGAIPFAMIEARLPSGWVPDMWVQVDAGFSLSGRPVHGRNVIVATDPHALNYDRQRGAADTFFCMQKCYSQAGDLYLPYAYDPTLHYSEDREQKYDGCLIGLPYDQRSKLIDGLRAAGLNIYADIGPAFDEYRALYSESLVALSWSSRDDLIARIFEGMAMDRPVVCNNVPDLPLFFTSGEDLATFDTLDQAPGS